MPYQHIPSSRPVPLNRPCLHPERNPQDESADSRQPTHLTVKKKNPRVCYLESYIHRLTGILFSPPSPSSPRFFPPQTTNLPLPLPRQSISRARGNIIRTIAAPPLVAGWMIGYLLPLLLILIHLLLLPRPLVPVPSAFCSPILLFLDAAVNEKGFLTASGS